MESLDKTNFRASWSVGKHCGTNEAYKEVNDWIFGTWKCYKAKEITQEITQEIGDYIEKVTKMP